MSLPCVTSRGNAVNIALLFDWRAYDDAGNYWWATRTEVFGSGAIQRSGRHMKLSVGDVLASRMKGVSPEQLCVATLASSEWQRFEDEPRLIDAFFQHTLFAMVFENMPRNLASTVHDALADSPGFLGAMSVHFESRAHLSLFRAFVSPTYRLHGTSLRAFYAMGDDDGCDEHDLREMRSLGYDETGFEDLGPARTILDDFDTPEHFQRVAAFRKLIAGTGGSDEDDAYAFSMLLEDLSPKLFNALGAAANKLGRAETDEDVAQAALSGRRYLEQLADSLFTARPKEAGKRNLSKAAYRNRLWAFIEANTKDPAILEDLGRTVDRLAETMNEGLHGSRDRSAIGQALVETATLTVELFGLNPEGARRPYFAHAAGVMAFARAVAEGHADQRSREG